MPYIKKEDRKYLEYYDNQHPRNPGEFNYLVTKLAHTYLREKGIKYQHFNDLIGALECCKSELYRRFITPYEDEKIQMNGDVKDLGGNF